MELKQLEARVSESENNGLLKININHREEGSEGVWACFVTPQDKDVYETSGEFDVFLMNHALIGRPSWGAKLHVKTNGDLRPVINVEDVINQIEEAISKGEYPEDSKFDE